MKEEAPEGGWCAEPSGPGVEPPALCPQRPLSTAAPLPRTPCAVTGPGVQAARGAAATSHTEAMSVSDSCSGAHEH